MTNIHDVAKKADVAISTVSNVISGKKYVSEEVKQKVLEVIKELEYEVDPIARSMKADFSKKIGVIITNMSRIFFPPLVRNVEKIADANDYTVVTLDTNDDFEKEMEYVNYLCRNRFDGIIIDSVSDIDAFDYFKKLSALKNRKKSIAVVSIERNMSAYGIDSVVSDNYTGAKSGTLHLISQGCNRIIHITGPLNSNMAENRLKGYLDAINEADINYLNTEIAFGDFSPQSGYNIVKKYIENQSIYTYDAIFASNDQMAVGVLKALKESQIPVPEKIKVMGFDDSFVSSIVDPSLTTVKVSSGDMGKVAAEILFRRIENPNKNPECRTIPAELVVRKSTDNNIPEDWDLMNW